jgi:molybdopterin molybdotransferase
VDLGIIGDRLEDLVAALDRALEADLVLSTGGVSVGEFDFVKDALAQVGVGAGFWKVAMRPGKPLAFGSAERGGRKVVVFGLPGNPVSCAVGFFEFVLPFVQAGFGAAPRGLPVVEVIAGEAFRQRPGRTGFERVRLSVEGSVIKAFKAGNPSSGALSGLARADGLLVLALASTGVEAGDRAEVQLLRPEALARAVAT